MDETEKLEKELEKFEKHIFRIKQLIIEKGVLNENYGVLIVLSFNILIRLSN